MNRLARRLDDGAAVADIRGFALGIARLVLLEQARSPQLRQDQLDEQRIGPAPAVDRDPGAAAPRLPRDVPGVAAGRRPDAASSSTTRTSGGRRSIAASAWPPSWGSLPTRCAAVPSACGIGSSAASGRAPPARPATRNPVRRTLLEATWPATGHGPPPCDRRTMPLDVVRPQIRRYCSVISDAAGAAALEDRYVADPARLEDVRAAEDALIDAFLEGRLGPAEAGPLRGCTTSPRRSIAIGWRWRRLCADGRQGRSSHPLRPPGSTGGWRWPRRWCWHRCGSSRAAVRRRRSRPPPRNAAVAARNPVTGPAAAPEPGPVTSPAPSPVPSWPARSSP